MFVPRSISKKVLAIFGKIHILLSMKQIFFKTVRENYRSIYARGPLVRTYTVGKRYKFPKSRPAHVFTHWENFKHWQDIADEIYGSRKESLGGNRVMVCYGEVISREVPCFDISDSNWDFTTAKAHLDTKDTCRDFIVIDEIPLPEYFNGVRPSENSLDEYYPKNVILPPNPIKKRV
jgi:hypothetical protein